MSRRPVNGLARQLAGRATAPTGRLPPPLSAPCWEEVAQGVGGEEAGETSAHNDDGGTLHSRLPAHGDRRLCLVSARVRIPRNIRRIIAKSPTSMSSTVPSAKGRDHS